MVAGTLKRPLIEPYTVPMTNKDRARTLLVTGSDFNYEQGVGAIAVGFYVLPRLYISYGIGVFEEGSVISVRYDLGKRFGVRVTSGQRDTGADLNYTIER
jgi:translocation and assembly module TamB